MVERKRAINVDYFVRGVIALRRSERTQVPSEDSVRNVLQSEEFTREKFKELGQTLKKWRETNHDGKLWLIREIELSLSKK